MSTTDPKAGNSLPTPKACLQAALSHLIDAVESRPELRRALLS